MLSLILAGVSVQFRFGNSFNKSFAHLSSSPALSIWVHVNKAIMPWLWGPHLKLQVKQI